MEHLPIILKQRGYFLELKTKTFLKLINFYPSLWAVHHWTLSPVAIHASRCTVQNVCLKIVLEIFELQNLLLGTGIKPRPASCYSNPQGR